MPGIGAHPRGLHLWCARRPLATARAVIFAQMVDDPSAHPERFPTPEAQERERQRLFRIIEQLVLWENTTNEDVLNQAWAEIRRSWAYTCLGAQTPGAQASSLPSLSDAEIVALMAAGKMPALPAFHDPFAGGGALPLEAQRLGLKSYASDLNPVAVLINKAMIEIPPKFASRPPVNPGNAAIPGGPLASRDAGAPDAGTQTWKGAQGLAEDVRYYGQWMRDEAEQRIGYFYPKIKITPAMVQERPDLLPYADRELTVIAWLWARTIASPNLAYAHIAVPLASTFMLSTKAGKEAYVLPVITTGSAAIPGGPLASRDAGAPSDGPGYRFTVKVGKPKNAAAAKNGTKLGGSRSNFFCLLSGTPMPFEYLRSEAKERQMGARLMAIVAEGNGGRVYLSSTPEMEAIALSAQPQSVPETELPEKALGFRIQEYGMTKWRDLFTPRQLVPLTTFADLMEEARGATAYADAVATYLAFTVDRCADFSNTCTRWVSSNQKVMNLFGKQAIAMTWDFPEAAILHDTVGDFVPACKYIADCIGKLPRIGHGNAAQSDAASSVISQDKVASTDPPYYDNIGYAGTGSVECDCICSLSERRFVHRF